MKDKDHLRNGGWHGAMTLIRSALALLTSLLALRILGTANYGYLVTWMSLFFVYLSLNSNAFTVLVVRLIESRQSAQDAKYTVAINSAVAFGLLSLLLLGLLELLGYLCITNITFSATQLPGDFTGLVLIMGLLTSIQIFVSLQTAVIEGGGRLDLATKSQIFGPVVICILFAINYFSNSEMSVSEYLYILCFGAAVDALVLARVRQKLKLIIFMSWPNLNSMRGLFQMLRAAGILQAASLLNLFLEPVNKFLLISFAGAPLVAAYDLAMKILYGVQHLFAAAMRVFLHMSNQGRLELGRAYAKVLILFGGPVVLAHVVGLLFVFFIAKYWADIEVNLIVIFFGIASISNLGMICITPLYMGLIARNEFLMVFKMHLLQALINVLFSCVLIPRVGLVGAAIGLLLSTLTNIYFIFANSDVERGALSDNNRDLVRLGRRVGALILILICVATWCIAEEGGVMTLCVLLSVLFYISCDEPLAKRLINYLFSKNDSK